MNATPSTLLTLDTLRPPPVRVRWLKRTVDVSSALIGLVFAGPIMVVLALAIRLDSPGPVIYRQTRLGGDGLGKKRRFTMFKFRSMRLDAEAAGPQWATAADPRVTRVGRFARKSRLDELPQLWNVLKGEMSLVGPRPERPAFIAQLSPRIPGYDDRVGAFKAGITGWAQVHCGYDTSVETARIKVAYDLAYAAHLYTLKDYIRMEARVMLATVFIMFSGKGAR